MKRMVILAAAVAAVVVGAPVAAHAFCGFYVSGADGKLFNNATQVVMMRQGTRTVLSMQNNYQGPPEDFAMVVPVPVVLKKENVKTLPHEVFDRVDKLGAPRLVEYWEQDPCMVAKYDEMEKVRGAAPPPTATATSAPADHGVKIEAKFSVGEYNVLVLSAKYSSGLELWLKEHKYKIPAGAAPYLKPYIESGSKFFVAKVDLKKVKRVDGRLTLSPLRFYYDSNEFSLPIRLGMINSSGKQDLIVNILAPGQRYQVANYKNVTIPTNLDVKEDARDRFGEFYAALFDRTLEKNPGAVVTEYAWDAGSCDPCPEPPLTASEVATLGADVLGKGGAPGGYYGYVLTRLHARYAKGGIDHDLVFKAAPPIQGGREMPGASGKLEEGAMASSMNNFQGRYAIRHEWTGPIKCDNPHRGVWGGPPAGTTNQIASGPVAATNVAFAPRGKLQLARIVRQDVPEIGLVAGKAGKGDSTPSRHGGAETGKTPPPTKKDKGCAAGGGSAELYGLLLACAALALTLRRRRRA